MGKAAYKPGEIVTAVLVEGRAAERDGTAWKPRPAVLIERVDGMWRVMGFTQLPCYGDGTPRVPCPPQNHRDFGPGTSWLWGPHPPCIPKSQIGEHLAWASNELVDAIADLIGRPRTDLNPMRPQG